MYFLGSRFFTLLVLVVCPCRVCLGDDRVKSRQSVYTHLRQHGTATNEEIRRHQAFLAGADFDRDNNLDETDFEDFNGLGGAGDDHHSEDDFSEDDDNISSDSDGLGDEDADIDWDNDPVYHKLKPVVAEMVGGGLLSV